MMMRFEQAGRQPDACLETEWGPDTELVGRWLE
jgi:hypothetical protein